MAKSKRLAIMLAVTTAIAWFVGGVEALIAVMIMRCLFEDSDSVYTSVSLLDGVARGIPRPH